MGLTNAERQKRWRDGARRARAMEAALQVAVREAASLIERHAAVLRARGTDDQLLADELAWLARHAPPSATADPEA